jgi:nitrile hydratase beta subunit
MNGVHDMGGMHGLGPIDVEQNEPVFHARWEGRTFALWRTLGAWGKWKGTRAEIERIPAADYLRMIYYERLLTALSELLVNTSLITRAELTRGKRARGTAKAVPPITAAQVPTLIARGAPSRRDVAAAPLFQLGQQVRARNINPTGHTRLPRYARGKRGVVERDHGVFVFPDTYVAFLGDKSQHVYSVRFAARDLWGEQASPHDAVYLDLWDDYLEPE